MPDLQSSGELDVALRDLGLAVQARRLYPPGSDVLGEAARRARSSLVPLLSDHPLELEVLPQSFQRGEEQLSGSVVGKLAELLHQRGVGRLRLTGQLTEESLSRLVELLAGDREDLEARGGLDWVIEREGLAGIEIESLHFERLFEEDGGGDGEAPADAVWTRLVGEFSGASGGKGFELETSEPEDLEEFVSWLHANVGKLAALEEARESDFLRAAWDRMGSVRAKAGPEQLNFLVLAVKEAMDQLDPDTVMEALSDPLPVDDDLDITDLLSEEMDSPAVERLILEALRTRSSSPRLYGLFNKLVAHQEDRGHVVRKVRQELDQAISAGAADETLVGSWSRLSEALTGEAPERFMRPGYQATLEQLTFGVTAADAWPVERLRPRLAEMEPYHLLRQKARVLASSLPQVEEDRLYLALVSELEQAVPELLVHGDFQTGEKILATLAEHAEDGERPQVQRDRAEEVVAGFYTPGRLRRLLEGTLAESDEPVGSIVGLLRIRGDPVVSVLFDLLSEADSRPFRERLIEMLVEMHHFVPTEIDQRLKDERWFFLRNLAKILGEIGRSEFADRLRPLLHHEDSRVRFEAACSLAKIGDDRAAVRLLGALRDEDRKVRLVAIHGIGVSGSSELAVRLIPLLSLSNWVGQNTDIIRTAAIALGRLGADDAAPQLERLTRRRWFFPRRRRPAREAAQWALRALDSDSPGRAPDIEWLVRELGGA